MGGLILAILGIFLILLIAKAQPISKRSYQPRPQYGHTAITHENIEVKSYSEKQLADYFTQNNIKYIYEPVVPIYAKPDFYLPEYDVYVEYWGLVDAVDPVKKYSYEKSMKRKMAIYHKHGYKFISIYPKNLENLDWVFRKKFETVTGKKLSPSQVHYDRDGVEVDLDFRTCYNCGLRYDKTKFSKCPECSSTRYYFKKI